MNRAVATVGVSMWVSALACAPVGLADTENPAPAPGPVAAQSVSAPAALPVASQTAPAAVPAGPQAAPAALPAAPQADNPVGAACGQFNAAVNVAAANYEDFAYATAGNGNDVNYQDQEVWRTNVIGRTALRQAAAAALSASRVDGLPPEVSDPMRSWSLRATKLLLVMGLHGGGDTLNSSVSEMNTLGHDALMACAANGFRG